LGDATYCGFRERARGCWRAGRGHARLPEQPLPSARRPVRASSARRVAASGAAVAASRGDLGAQLGTAHAARAVWASVRRAGVAIGSILTLTVTHPPPAQVRRGNEKRYQQWFLARHVPRPDAEGLVPDLVRYVCAVCHLAPHVRDRDSLVLPRCRPVPPLLNTLALRRCATRPRTCAAATPWSCPGRALSLPYLKLPLP